MLSLCNVENMEDSAIHADHEMKNWVLKSEVEEN